jgi:hypothetical protein
VVSPFGSELHGGFKVTISDGYPPAASPEHIYESIQKALDDEKADYKIVETKRDGRLFKSYSVSTQ